MICDDSAGDADSDDISALMARVARNLVERGIARSAVITGEKTMRVDLGDRGLREVEWNQFVVDENRLNGKDE